MSSSESKIRINKFNGTKEHWPVFKEQFLAFAYAEGFRDEIEGVNPIPSDSAVIDESTDSGKRQLRSQKANRKGYQSLLFLIDGTKAKAKTAFLKVSGAKTSDNPRGNVKVAWEELVKHYEPKNFVSKRKLKKNYEKFLLGRKSPDDWITEMKQRRIEYVNAGGTVTEQDFIERLLENVDQEAYRVEVKLLNKDMNEGKTVDIDRVTTELTERYDELVEMGMLNKMISEVNVDDDSSSSQSTPAGINNIAMFTGNFGGRYNPKLGSFRGVCYYCNTVCGNTAANCKKRKEDEQTKTKRSATSF